MKIQIDITTTHIHKHNTLHYSVYIYRMSNIIDFLSFGVAKKENILLECFFILHGDVIVILR